MCEFPFAMAFLMNARWGFCDNGIFSNRFTTSSQQSCIAHRCDCDFIDFKEESQMLSWHSSTWYTWMHKGKRGNSVERIFHRFAQTNLKGDSLKASLCCFECIVMTQKYVRTYWKAFSPHAFEIIYKRVLLHWIWFNYDVSSHRLVRKRSRWQHQRNCKTNTRNWIISVHNNWWASECVRRGSICYSTRSN